MKTGTNNCYIHKLYNKGAFGLYCELYIITLNYQLILIVLILICYFKLTITL